MNSTDDTDTQRLFRHAAARYDRYRAPYPADLVRALCRLCSLGADSRVMDLGCGPGTLARLFAPVVGSVLGIDPEPEMIRHACQAVSFDNVEFVVGSSRDLRRFPGPFDAVAIGRALHWMDSGTIAERLRARVRPGGWIAIVSSPRAHDARNAWWEAIRPVRLHYDPTNGARASRPPAVDPEVIFAGKPFAPPLYLETRHRRELTVSDLLGLLHTIPGTTPIELGARLTSFERDVRTAVAPFLRDGMLGEFLSPGAILFRCEAA